jgi:uncharacterized protein (DUF433 family)
MMLEIQALEVPIAFDVHGVAKVGGTRVTLETVIDAFREGNTAEDILMRYPALSLASIYQVIGYYLDHRAEVDAYIEQAQVESERVRSENNARPEVMRFREKMLARKIVFIQ